MTSANPASGLIRRENVNKRQTRARAYRLVGGAAIAAATLALHGWSLGDGTVLDDHWHQKGLREHGWSPDELLRTLVIEPAEFLDLWWQDTPVRWEYGRPVFILAMKIVYHVLGHDDPLGLHLFSVALHFASACMVWRLCFLLTRQRFWSVGGGVLFAIYHHSVVTVAWPSSLNAVLQTFFMLAALLCYLRASRLDVSAVRDLDGPEPPRPRVGLLAVALNLWILAIFTRENALMLPLILLAFDGVFGGRRHVWARRWVYATFALVAVGFVLWRVANVTHAMPDVYVRWPDGDWIEYSLWCAAKLLHYLSSSIWIAPMTVGPTGRINPWAEAPGDCLLMLGIVAAIGLGYFVSTRKARGYWIWPLWILLSMLPVVPVIATPHSGYMSGVGFAVGATLAAGLPRRGARHPHGRSVWLARCSAGYVVVFFLLLCPFSMFSRWQWTGTIAAERYATAGVVASPPPREVTDVFFINLPFVNVYIKPALDAELGPSFRGVRCHVLTFSPQPVLVLDRCRLTQLDDRSFSVEIEGQPYFSRLLGRFLIEGFRAEAGRFHSGDRVHGEAFDVRIAAADEEGVRKLVFTFPKPLRDPGYCFYLATRDFPAARLRFRSADARAETPVWPDPAPTHDEIATAVQRLAAGEAAAAETLFAALGLDREDTSSVARDGLRAVLLPVADALAAPLAPLLERPRPSREELELIRIWWHDHIDDEVLRELWIRRETYARFVKMREEVPHAREWAALAVRTDLYLTGPPFAGPR